MVYRQAGYARRFKEGGFVFVNLDPDCESLDSYLEILPAHLDEWSFD